VRFEFISWLMEELCRRRCLGSIARLVYRPVEPVTRVQIPAQAV
jgi:hypothetical protein